MDKKKVLFVGAFNTTNKDGSTGGQLFACMTIINSDLKDSCDFIKIDSTIPTVPIPGIVKRAQLAFKRMLVFLYYLLTKKVDSVLIFSGDSFSFLEKGVMALIATKIFRKKTIFCPRSGMSLRDYDTSKFMRWFMPKVINSVSYVLCQGTIWKEFYTKISQTNDDKFKIVHNWIDIDKYSTIHYKTSINQKIQIVYIGWIEEFKGVFDLVKALKILSDKGIAYTCSIYGKGSASDKLAEAIEEHDLEESVKMKGWADPKIKEEALRMADIYVQPSHFEGFPNSVLEAMSAELPVISSRVGAIEDIIQDTKNGLLFESKDVNSLSDKIEQLISEEDYRVKIAENARRTVYELFSIDTAVKKFKEFI